MARGNFSVRSGTRVGNFNVPLSLMESVSGLTTANLNAVAVDGNGITGVEFAVNGSGRSYNIAVTLPQKKTGRFKLSLQGTVTVGGITEAVTSNEITIAYDTASVVVANWEDIEYREGGEIVLPVVFGEDITYLHKTDFTLERVEGDEVWECIDRYWLVQRADADTGNLVNPRTFYLHFQMHKGYKGRFRVSLTGYVWKTLSTVRDDVRIDPIEIPYSTIVPEIVDFDIPGNYAFGRKFYVLVAFNTPVSGWHLSNTLTEVWLEEGAKIGTPTPYKWVGTDPPDIHATVPDPLPSDWQRLTAPPGGHRGEWHGEEGQYFLIDWLVSEGVSGTFNLSLRPNNVLRGPVS